MTFLHQCDRIVFLEKGVIKETGTYEELTKGTTALSVFIGEYLNSHKNDDEEEEKDDKKKKYDLILNYKKNILGDKNLEIFKENLKKMRNPKKQAPPNPKEKARNKRKQAKR